jgi:hypothetical protein
MEPLQQLCAELQAQEQLDKDMLKASATGKLEVAKAAGLLAAEHTQ